MGRIGKGTKVWDEKGLWGNVRDEICCGVRDNTNGFIIEETQ